MRRKRVIAGLCVLLVLACSGLLLTGVQRVREAAAVAKCHCNIHCLAFALHGYSDTHGSILATVPLPSVPPERRLSWIVAVLPFMEQDTAYRRFDLTAPVDAERNRVAAETHLRHLICHSSVEIAWGENREALKSPTSITHYVGIAGVGADAAELPQKHERAGAFGYDRKTYIDSSVFTDGRSTTFLVVETAHEPGHWALGGSGTVWPFVPDAAPYVGPGRPFGGIHGGARVGGWAARRAGGRGDG